MNLQGAAVAMLISLTASALAQENTLEIRRDRFSFGIRYEFDLDFVERNFEPGASPCNADPDCPAGYVCETTRIGECNSPIRACIPGCRYGERWCAGLLRCVDVTCKTCPCSDRCEQQPCDPSTAQPCGLDGVCSYPIGSGCGSGIAGSCIDRPVSCPGTLLPVCGCNGESYRNPCFAYREGISISHYGACHDPCSEPTHEIINGGFENGTYDGWKKEYGSNSNGIHVLPRIRWGQEEKNQAAPTVVSASTPLMKKQGKAVAPYCGTSMLRINDLIGSANATRIKQMFIRPAGTGPCSVLKFHWGAMLEDAGHDEDEQPFFKIEALVEGKAFYTYRADASTGAAGGWTNVALPGAEPVWYRDSLITIPLIRTRAGDEIEIRISVADCAPGDHGGAAFLDCVSIMDRCANSGCPFVGQQALGTLHVPNVFTPNGDGINDTWAIGNAAPACTATAKIYDRWGTLVAEPEWGNGSETAPGGVIPLWFGIRDDGTPALQSANPYYYVLKVSSCFDTKEIPGFFYIYR